ncbi:hypothetical protein D3C71_2121420 [compost metagenome]
MPAEAELGGKAGRLALLLVAAGSEPQARIGLGQPAVSGAVDGLRDVAAADEANC